MWWKLIYLGISILSFSSFIAFIWIKYGAQGSVSKSYYKLRKKYKVVFSLAIGVLAIPLTMIAVSRLMLAACGLITVVGLAANFKESKLEKIVHMVGAFGGSGLSLLSIWLFYGLWQVVVIDAIIALFISIGLYIFNKNTYIWWMELIVIVSTWVVLFMDIIK